MDQRVSDPSQANVGLSAFDPATIDAEALAPLQDTETARQTLLHTMISAVGRDPAFATAEDWFYALAHAVRGVIAARSIRVSRAVRTQNKRRVYYLSMEYLLGRSLTKYLLDLGILETIKETLAGLGQDFDAVQAHEHDAALGNGGLGRLAACFMESMATHGYPGLGYGIRFEFGMFVQKIVDGQQVEEPESWLHRGNPWEIERSQVVYPVHFHGKVLRFRNAQGEQVSQWVDTETITALAFDQPVSGHGSGMVANLRLWSARSPQDLNLAFFNQGDMDSAVRAKTVSESLSKVLYPNDSTPQGQELRLKQEYFFVSASIQDILRRFRDHSDNWAELPDHVSLQINDTHPALAVAELMRLLVDREGLDWEDAWAITAKVCNYTCHTLLPEALETWPIGLLEHVLPRHLEIIYQINHHFLEDVKVHFPGDPSVLHRMSLVDDGARRIRMAHLAIVGSRRVNGVAALHTQLMKAHVFRDFDQMWPDRFVNMTNGITPRRWLLQANPSLAALVTEAIGDAWISDLDALEALAPLADDTGLQDRFMAIKAACKDRVAALCQSDAAVTVDPGTLFDVQIKRIHEYKRQLLNLMHVIDLYVRIRENGENNVQPRTVIFAGKAASGYVMAKTIIRLIHDVASVVNSDPAVRDCLRVAFIPNYNVSRAEVLIPGANLSEQISTAGTEASGTGNMKFALNGALTIGTLDGANIEIRDAVGADAMIIFGLNAEEVHERKVAGYNPWDLYHGNERLRRVVDMIRDGYFCPDDPGRYVSVVDSLLSGGDPFMLLADFDSYVDAQDRAAAAFQDTRTWARNALWNVAHVGRFSSDRTIHAYAKEIWRASPVKT